MKALTKHLSNPKLVIPGIFTIGTLLGIFLWDKIFLPFSNPWNILSQLTVAGENPSDDLVRFLVLIAIPSLFLLLWTYFSKPKSKDKKDIQENLVESEYKPANLSIWHKRILLGLLICFTIIGALTIPTDNVNGPMDTYHEGMPLATELAWSNGQTPYKDFSLWYGVLLEPVSTKIAYTIFGKSVGAHRSLFSVYKIALYLLILFVVYQLFAGNALYTLAAMLLLFFLNTSAIVFYFTSYQFWKHRLFK